MKSKKRINWKQTWQNNLYMLGFIHKAAPGLIAMQLTSWGLNALRYFFMQIFLFNYVLNALQTGETLSTMLLTVGAVCMIALLSVVFRQIELRYTSLTGTCSVIHLKKVEHTCAYVLHLNKRSFHLLLGLERAIY